MAIDCEMDILMTDKSVEDIHDHGFTARDPGLVCKITLVNEHGEIVLDTLVNYFPQSKINLTETSKKVKKRAHFEVNESSTSNEQNT